VDVAFVFSRDARSRLLSHGNLPTWHKLLWIIHKTVDARALALADTHTNTQKKNAMIGRTVSMSSSLACCCSSSSSSRSTTTTTNRRGATTMAAKRRRATSSSSRRFDFSSKSSGGGTESSQRLNAVVDPGSSLDEFVELSASSDDDGSIRCSIDGDDFTVSKAEMEAERLRKKMASMGGEMLRDPKDFVSTDGQRLQCAVHFGVCSLLAMRGLYLDAVVMDGDVVGLAARAFATVFASYVLADLGTGIFHWSVDNYGDKNTPVAGNVIDAFQGHHRWPWTITKRQWANNIHKTCIAPLFFTVPQLLVFGGSDMQGSGDSDLFFGSFWALVVLSQQTHAWAHMKPSDQPKIVTKLQDMNLMLTRKDHGAHHRSPFEGHYCIINGWWNPLLDDSHFFRKLERVIYEKTGVAPRCWTEDDFEVEEDAPDGFGQGIL
jgi:hypothetical protein